MLDRFPRAAYAGNSLGTDEFVDCLKPGQPLGEDLFDLPGFALQHISRVNTSNVTGSG